MRSDKGYQWSFIPLMGLQARVWLANSSSPMVKINWQESSLPQWWSITTEALTPHHPCQCSPPKLHCPKYSSSQLVANHGSSPTSVPCHNQRLMHSAYFSHIHDSLYGAKNWNKILQPSNNKLQATYKMQHAICNRPTMIYDQNGQVKQSWHEWNSYIRKHMEPTTTKSHGQRMKRNDG